MIASIPLIEADITTTERVALATPGVTASVFRYPTGVAALRLANARGHVIVLPWLGQIVWDAVFDGVRLTMQGLFDAPRPASTIVDTYTCFAYHSGLLRNGCPGPEDTHPLHGEFSCAAMDSAALELSADGAVRLASTRLYAQGFGNRYRATPSVTLRPGETLFDIDLAVENTGGQAMDLMYMCHINFDFVQNGRILQSAPFTPEHVAVRTATPLHVPRTERHTAMIAALGADPSPTETLDEATGYNPEQVFYLRGLGCDADGVTRMMLRRPEGDAFAMAFSLREFPHPARWIMVTPDHRVAAFALPATCHPEGYTAERGKGHVASLAPGEARRFSVRTGYLDSAATRAMAAEIAARG